MKILTIHADYLEFTAKKKAFKQAEEGVTKDTEKIKECLVIFTAVEKGDEKNLEAVMKKYLQEVKNISSQLQTNNIVVYPYAHLSNDLSSPKVAEQFLKDAQLKLGEIGFTVSRAPFGWYKSFTVACKGHPLSELSRSFGPEEETKLKREFTDEPFVWHDEELSQQQKLSFSTALIAAKAVKLLFSSAQVAGMDFYQDEAYVDIAQATIRKEDFSRIEKKMREIIRQDTQFTEGKDLNSWQQKIRNDIGEDKLSYSFDDISVIPTYFKPFVQSASAVKAFKVLKTGSAYWKGNQNNKQLTRLNVIGFASEENLNTYLKEQEAARERSHIKIGKDQNLFVVSDLVGPGLPLLAPKGMILRKEIIDYLWQLHKHRGYQQVWTPHIAKQELYKTSGHWDKFGDDLFHVQGKTDKFVIKPMNCPHHMQIFDSFSLSYRDMPVRFFEPATIYRDEKSGQLHGLSRVRSITQDDGHLFCRVSQIEQEVRTIANIINQFFTTLKMEDYWVSLSVRGEDKSQYLGGDDVWEKAESALENAAKAENLPFKKIKGEAAFYGPKLDFMFKDALGREWQLSTIQCDFNMPERFKLSFMNEKSEKEQPVVIHRAICGSIERFMSLLIEHFAGKFPLWLSPVQVKIITVTDRSNDFAYDLAKQLRQHDIRVEVDDRSETMGRKIRDAQLAKANYILTIGDKELENKTLAVRSRDGEQEFGVSVEDLVKKVVKERDDKTI